MINTLRYFSGQNQLLDQVQNLFSTQILAEYDKDKYSEFLYYPSDLQLWKQELKLYWYWEYKMWMYT